MKYAKFIKIQRDRSNFGGHAIHLFFEGGEKKNFSIEIFYQSWGIDSSMRGDFKFHGFVVFLDNWYRFEADAGSPFTRRD